MKNVSSYHILLFISFNYGREGFYDLISIHKVQQRMSPVHWSFEETYMKELY